MNQTQIKPCRQKGIRTMGLALLLCFACVFNSYANPYDNPYNPIQNVKSMYAIEVPSDKGIDYNGEVDAQNKVSQFDFTDVSGAQKVAASLLAVFDISKGNGNKIYGGSQNVTNIEAIGMLVRMYGNDQTIRQQVTTANPGVTGDRFNQAMNDAYFAEAKQLGIIGANESVSYKTPATRENLGVWLVKAAKIDAAFKQNALYKAKDWEKVRIENLGAIETLVDLGIMPLQSKSFFNPTAKMNRKEWAQVLHRVFDEFTEALGLETHYGQVVGNRMSTDPTGSFQDFYIREVDDTIKRIQLKKPIRGKASGLVVFKNRIQNQSSLVIGDEVRYLVKDNVVRFVEVLAKDQVKSRLLEQLKQTEKIESHQGIVISVTPETVKTNGLNQKNLRVRIETDDDKMVDLISGRDYNLNIQNEYLVIKGTSFISPSALKKGDQLTFYAKEDKVLYASLGKIDPQVIIGTLRLVSTTQDPPQIAMFDRSGNLKIFPVSPEVKVSVNFYAAKLEDLKPGASTTVSVLNNKIVSVSSDSYQPIPGYIPDDGKIRMATVKSISANKVVLQGEEKVYEIGPNTAVYRETKLVPLSVLKAGDQVKLYFNNIYSNMPTRVVIAGKDQFITKIVKGTVYSYNPNTLQIGLSERSKLVNTTWVKETDPFTQVYSVTEDTLISNEGKPVSRTELSGSYLRREAYFVIRNQLGKAEISQMVFSGGGERTYKETVKSFSNVIDRMVLKDNRTVIFGPDTLFIQNQRLVDKNALRVDGTVQVITNVVDGQEVAKVVRLMTTADSLFDNVYVGSIDDVFSYSLNLTNFSKVANYVWPKTDQGKKLLQFTDSTRIYNATTGKDITREAFFNGPYSRIENDSTDGRGLPKDSYYGFFVADEKNMIKAMHIRFKELFKNDPIDDAISSDVLVAGKLDNILRNTTFTIGTIGELDSKWKRVGLVDSQNYLSFHNEWVFNSTLTNVELGDALILKGDQVMTYDELKVDDLLYLVRSDEDAMIVFVGP